MGKPIVYRRKNNARTRRRNRVGQGRGQNTDKPVTPDSHDPQPDAHETCVLENEVSLHLQDDGNTMSGSPHDTSIDKRTLRRDPDKTGRQIPKRESGLTHIKGRRIVTIEDINAIAVKSVSHAKVCPLGALCELKLTSESRTGLNSKFRFSCSCGYSFYQRNDTGRVTIPINDSVVWASHSSGVGFATMKTTMNIFEIPFMDFKTYQVCENRILELFEKARMDHLIENGKAELEASRVANDIVVIDGEERVCTTVQVDGGWSKRSYGHSFNASSGVAVIIGMRTKKIIWMSTRNKDCYQCTVNLKNGIVKEHKCYKNWSGSSSAMETDIILEGFRCSLDMHGLIYRRMIGDGDSSVFADIEYVYKGLKVEKIECVNHFMKNLTSKIYKIIQNKLTTKNAPKIPKNEQNLLSAHKEHITIGVRKAIEYNSVNRPTTSVQTLIEDLENVLNHVFGDHTKCKSYFCRKNTVGNPMDKIKTSAFYRPLCEAINRAVTLSTRLIHNCLSNDAEHFMAACCKFISGKRLYYSRRGGYNMRMISAMFCYDECSFWADKMYRTIYCSSPTTPWTVCRSSSQRLKEKICPSRRNRAKRKLFQHKVTLKSGADSDYGPLSRDGDIDESILKQQVEKLYCKLQVDLIKQQEIELETRQQSDSPLWFDVRRDRITASNAKRVFKLQDSTSNNSILDSLLYPANLDHVDSIRYGRMNELKAIRKYEIMTNTNVTRCGIFVSLENGIFAASPDGLVGQDGLVEIKCPYVLKDMNPSEYGSVCRKNPCIKRNKTSGEYELVKSHQYYFQVIMMLHVTQRNWCDLMVWSSGPTQINKDTGIWSPVEQGGMGLIFRINRNQDTATLWEQMMPKFVKFWHEEIAPEIVDPRKVRGQQYRQPEYRVAAINNKRNKLRTPLSLASSAAQKISKESDTQISSGASSSRLTTIAYVPAPTIFEEDTDSD